MAVFDLPFLIHVHVLNFLPCAYLTTDHYYYAYWLRTRTADLLWCFADIHVLLLMMSVLHHMTVCLAEADLC